MFKTVASALLLALTQANPNNVGVPPHSHNCATEKTAKLAYGLSRDYDMGGCKCNDDTAEWGPGKKLAEEWSCWCQVPDTYESFATVGLTDDANRRECGVILSCQTAAVLQQKALWAQEMQRLKKERSQAKVLNKKQLVKENELNSVRHVRKERTKQNRVRARIALQVTADQYKQVKMAFVSGSIAKETMAKAHVQAAQQVAAIRGQWKTRQNQIDSFYENAVARTITMENFVDSDQSKVDQYFQDKANELKQRYGTRIQNFMMIPTITNVYKQYNLIAETNSAKIAIQKTNLGTKVWKATTANLRSQQDPSVCPLYQ